MKKYNLICSILLLPFLLACDDDDVDPNPVMLPDSENPVVIITSPVAGDSFVVIDRVGLDARVTDNVGLADVSVFLSDPNGTSGLEDIFDTQIPNPYWNKNFALSTLLPNARLRLPSDSTTVTYTVIVEAADRNDNMAKSSTTFTVHAPNLNRDEFARAFDNINVFGALDWWGYNSDNGIEFDKTWFSMGFFFMVDSNYDNAVSRAEWYIFTADYDIKDQTWSAWDGDGDGSLTSAEFQNGLLELDFFTDWDIDQNKLIREDELAYGIFERWDHNDDNFLSRSEYEERFFTYLHR